MGFEVSLARHLAAALQHRWSFSYANTGDLVVLISVSGESENLIKAAELSKEIGLTTITFTGRSKNNSLSKLGDISFWVDSHAYNIVECIHMIWITSVIG